MFVTLALFVVLAGCSAGGGATGGPTSAPAASTSPVVTSTSLASLHPTGSGYSSAAEATDAAGDVTPSYLDIVALRAGAEAGSGTLTLGLDLAGAVPPGSPAVGQLAYVFSLDVDGDGVSDHTATLKLVPEGGFRPSLVARTGGSPREGPDYPGTADLTGSTVSLTLRLDAIGCPARVGVRAASQQTKAGVTAGDAVPDASDGWIAVSTDCQPTGS